MATNKRYYDWFNCDVELTLHLAGQVRTMHTWFSFYCAFSLRALQEYVNISYFLPKRFCDAKLSFRRIGPALYSNDPHCPRFLMRSYDAINQMAIRHIIYTLTIDKLIYEFQVDKTL